MNRLLLALMLLVSLVGCDGSPSMNPRTIYRVPPQERPTVNLPRVLRQQNWLGNQREGSCVWASTIMLLRWQGRYEVSDWIRKYYGNGEWPEDWSQKMDKIGLRYAMTTNGDERFLEWCVKTRRGAGVTVMGGAHMVMLVHLDAKWAGILDNNQIDKIIWVPRETFLAEWHASNGWGLTVIYSPAAPLP